jgi:hypothetical protein
MAETTKIQWCDHTFNPWIGCTKVAAGCTNCYAENLMDARYGKAKWWPNGFSEWHVSQNAWQISRQLLPDLNPGEKRRLVMVAIEQEAK